MENKEIPTSEQWLKQRDYSNSIISHPMAGDQYVASVSDAMREYAKCVVNSLEAEKEPDTTTTLAVDELNLDEKAQQLTDTKFPDAHNYLHSQPYWYKQGCIDALKSIHNHASFVALVEALKTLLSFAPDKNELGGSAWDSDFGVAILKAEEALTKIK